MYEKFLEEVKKAEKITIFRHTHPDGDAVGSQLGCCSWIKDNFPSKEVRVLGFDKFDLYPVTEEVDDDFIDGSLAVIFDTSTAERTDDQRYQKAKLIIRIDHHPVVENFEDILIAEPQRSSACELLTSILREAEEKEGYFVSCQCAAYLYSGILTDTLNFRTSNTGEKTLENAAYLAGKGISVSDLSARMFEISEKQFSFRTKLRNYASYQDGLCFIQLNKEDLCSLQVDMLTAKNAISEFGNVKEYQIWAIVVYNPDTGLYDGSLRSKKEYTINEIASHYHGGGHKQAAGIKNLNVKEIDFLKAELINEIKRVKSGLQTLL